MTSNIMRRPSFHAEAIIDLLQQEKIATLEQMKVALGTQTDMTVFRKLREIPYLASYSHRGRYYTLSAMARFDDQGLWSYRDVHFSRTGSLVDTVNEFVSASPRGYFSSELAGLLQVQVKEPLLNLVRRGDIAREEVSGLYLYCSTNPEKRRQQFLMRSIPAVAQPWSVLRDPRQPMPEEARDAMAAFIALLNERQRRLYAGLESLRMGRGGDQRVSEITGLDVRTIARGRQELLADEPITTGGIRRPGGGRHAVEKKRRGSSR